MPTHTETTATTSKRREHGRLFKGPMVRAILEGHKTESRRPLQPQPWRLESKAPGGSWAWSPNPKAEGLNQVELLMSYDHSVWADMNGRLRPHLARFSPVRPGDRLWVRETFVLEQTDELPADGRPYQELDCIDGARLYLVPHYRATEPEPHIVPQDLPDSRDDRTRWSPSIHMPRWACRIVVALLDVHAERLQDITPEGVLAEGIDPAEAIDLPCNPGDALVGLYSKLWEDLYPDPALSWEANPWIWVYKWPPYHPEVIS
jgi:hypothetical protein